MTVSQPDYGSWLLAPEAFREQKAKTVLHPTAPQRSFVAAHRAQYYRGPLLQEEWLVRRSFISDFNTTRNILTCDPPHEQGD